MKFMTSFVVTMFIRLHTYFLADSVAYMDVWLLDGVEYQEQLLHYVLSKEKCHNTLVVIAVDLSQPWEVMDSLQRWTEVVRNHLNSLKIPHKEYADMQEAGNEKEKQIKTCVII